MRRCEFGRPDLRLRRSRTSKFRDRSHSPSATTTRGAARTVGPRVRRRVPRPAAGPPGPPPSSTGSPTMSTWALLLIALSLSADAFAVALGKGLHIRRLTIRDTAAVAVAFGAFQGLMPLLGWLLGVRLAGSITEVDHWIAFGLLAVIGGKMLYEAFTQGDDDEPDEDHVGLRELLVLSVATSIDALAV